MLDRHALPHLQRLLDPLARVLVRLGVGANALTLIAFLLGLSAAVLIATHAYLAGTMAIIGSRILDGLDGAVARLGQPTDAGAFLDIVLDFLFYASIPLAFAVADPSANALAAAVLLAAFIGTGASFLAFAVLAGKRGMASTAYPDKSFYFLGGLTEGAETLACFVAMCLWPQHFATLAFGFAALCGITTLTRIWWGWRSFQ
ncbi:MAG: CDP-alcohol phosphatidyltransferase family protein [Rhodoferax sp.]|nr:MAG: CDP-alcohol phosphatidyltransferase family protein [Rhodoferax sp.]